MTPELDSLRASVAAEQSAERRLKSALGGRLSGFVPFLQISEESDKRKVGTSPPDARTRIFFSRIPTGHQSVPMRLTPWSLFAALSQHRLLPPTACVAPEPPPQNLDVICEEARGIAERLLARSTGHTAPELREQALSIDRAEPLHGNVLLQAVRTEHVNNLDAILQTNRAHHKATRASSAVHF